VNTIPIYSENENKRSIHNEGKILIITLHYMVQINRAAFWKHVSPYPVLKLTVNEESTDLVRYELAVCHRVLINIFLTTSGIST
jgi:hypothetical protein